MEPMTSVDAPDSADTAALLDLAVRAAHAAGAELLRRYGHVEGLDTKSSATDPVSDADRASEVLLTEMITAERPQDGLLGEEGASRVSQSGLVWVVDPLDGTVNYLYELGNWAVSVAVEDDAGGLIGVVFDPVLDRTFTATRDGGAWLAGRRLQVNEPVPMSRALIATGFGYLPERRATQGAMIARLLPQIRDIRRYGSAALDLCAVAAGFVDGYFEEGVQRWDVAAGGLVAREAGAVMTPCTPTGVSTGWLVAGATLHAALEPALITPIG
jgi:myo-inositol-1(or 4)-monophosphatase